MGFTFAEIRSIMSVKPKYICLFIGHNWDKFNGYYEEKIDSKAKCKRCGKKYEDTRSGGRSQQNVDVI